MTRSYDESKISSIIDESFPPIVQKDYHDNKVCFWISGKRESVSIWAWHANNYNVSLKPHLYYVPVSSPASLNIVFSVHE